MSWPGGWHGYHSRRCPSDTRHVCQQPGILARGLEVRYQRLEEQRSAQICGAAADSCVPCGGNSRLEGIRNWACRARSGRSIRNDILLYKQVIRSDNMRALCGDLHPTNAEFFRRDIPAGQEDRRPSTHDYTDLFR